MEKKDASIKHSSDVDLQRIVAHCKAYGFVFPSSEIYGSLQAVYDYGPYGVLLKDRIQRFWSEAYRLSTAGPVVGLDAAIFMAPQVWESSGHAAHFADFFVDHRESKKRYRLDVLIENALAEASGERKKKLAMAFEKAQKAESASAYEALLGSIPCPVAKNTNWGAVRRLALMFSTEAGATTADTRTLYLRPETAQGIYVNFLNIQKALRLQLPFGVAQIGKAFRNELIARQFLFRTREFTQMEMQWFSLPDDATQWFQHWQQQRLRWYEALGIRKEALRLHPHEQLAHYAAAATDIEYHFPFGWKEIEGIHHRGTFDLSQHAQYAGKRLGYSNEDGYYLPAVVETSAGLDRICLMMLCEAYRELTEDNKTRVLLSFPPPFAPIQVAIFPLLRQAPLVKRAQALAQALRPYFTLAYEESASIGKRYARQDVIGTPYCVTIDHQTLEDDSVTLRKRDNAQQIRLPASELQDYLNARCSFVPLLKNRPLDTT